MKKQLVFILILMIMPLVVACGDDGDDIVDVKSYIVGKWHSTTGEVYAYGEKASVRITKTGDMSAAYYEIMFYTNGTLSFSYWKSENNGLTQWVEEKGTYTIKGDVVTITDRTGDKSDFLFDAKQRSLCMHMFYTYNGTQATINIYLKK